MTDLEQARERMEIANDQLAHERNSGDGKPSLTSVDKLTDAVTAYLAARWREKAEKMTGRG